MVEPQLKICENTIMLPLGQTEDEVSYGAKVVELQTYWRLKECLKPFTELLWAGTHLRNLWNPTVVDGQHVSNHAAESNRIQYQKVRVFVRKRSWRAGRTRRPRPSHILAAENALVVIHPPPVAENR